MLQGKGKQNGMKEKMRVSQGKRERERDASSVTSRIKQQLIFSFMMQTFYFNMYMIEYLHSGLKYSDRRRKKREKRRGERQREREIR